MRLTYDHFGDKIDAYLMYLASLPADDALAALEERIEDGTWRRSPDSFLTRIENLLYRGADRRKGRRLFKLLFNKLVALEIGPEAHALLPRIFQGEERTVVQARTVVRWFVARAGPGEASLAADLFETLANRVRLDEMQERGSSWLEPAADLARWLIFNGSAELRSRRRSLARMALPWIVANAFDDRALVAQTLRLVASSEEGIGTPYPGWPEGMIRLLTMVDHATQGLEGPFADLVHSAKGAPDASLLELVLDPPDGWPSLPRLQGHVVQLLAGAELDPSVWERGWQSAYQMAYPEGLALVFRTAETARVAMHTLRYHAAFGHRSYQRKERLGPDMRKWAWHVTAAYVRLHDLCGTAGAEPAIIDMVNGCVGYKDPVDQGVRDALLASLGSVNNKRDSRFLARTLLRQSETSAATKAAILALPRRPLAAQNARFEEQLATETLLARILHHPWTRPVAGIDVAALFGRARRIELAALSDEDKVRVEGEVVRVDRASLQGALAVPLDPQKRLAIGALYFVHELIHVAQAIGDKTVVSKLRSVGFAGETNLMHMDLGADDAAARIVAVAFPTWDLTMLKELQGRSLIAFPASARHSTAGRARKLSRLVGLRVDYLLRCMQIMPAAQLAGGYAFADFGPAGGVFVVMRSGPPFAHLGFTDLTPADAKALAEAVEPTGAGLEALDNVLRRLLRSACGKPAG